MPLLFGRVYVLSAVRVPAFKSPSLLSVAEPSNTTPLLVETTSTSFVIVFPVTVRSPLTERFPEIAVELLLITTLFASFVLRRIRPAEFALPITKSESLAGPFLIISLLSIATPSVLEPSNMQPFVKSFPPIVVPGWEICNLESGDVVPIPTLPPLALRYELPLAVIAAPVSPSLS